MRAGQLRHRVQIQEAADTRASDGSLARTWATVRTCWASIEPLRGQELWEAQQVQARVNTRVRMRYWAGLTPEHRIKHGTDVYNIAAVLNPEGRSRELEVLCMQDV